MSHNRWPKLVVEDDVRKTARELANKLQAYSIVTFSEGNKKGSLAYGVAVLEVESAFALDPTKQGA